MTVTSKICTRLYWPTKNKASTSIAPKSIINDFSFIFMSCLDINHELLFSNNQAVQPCFLSREIDKQSLHNNSTTRIFFRSESFRRHYYLQTHILVQPVAMIHSPQGHMLSSKQQNPHHASNNSYHCTW